ncbi:hypothetical protein DXG01_007043 [Tephrocybe rancida]|nr:hypothetical protein DXG01_007043 [Tephrocybe rancida]
MATRSYTIYSHYDPQKKESIPQRDTSSQPESSDSESWEFDPAFKPPPAPPPRFVPATLPVPEWDSGNALASSSKLSNAPTASEVSSWYRSLTSNRAEKLIKVQPSPSSLPSCDTQKPPSKPVEKTGKNNWFILNAIHSNPEVQSVGKTSSSTTLADIIARDPPPLPDEQRFKPPVWLEIGPSNKGFAMLQRSGWSEGEPLGPDVVRQPTVASHTEMIDMEARKEWNAFVKQETIEVGMEGYDDVTELRQVDIIDLTASDSEPDAEDDNMAPSANLEGGTEHLEPNGTHGRTALLVPIATVLKSDRLGIGLKARTVGPYRASQKRVTHNAAAMAAHIRAAEESRQKKKQFGRGSRGYNVQRKRDEADRKHLLAYMND